MFFGHCVVGASRESETGLCTAVGNGLVFVHFVLFQLCILRNLSKNRFFSVDFGKFPTYVCITPVDIDSNGRACVMCTRMRSPEIAMQLSENVQFRALLKYKYKIKSCTTARSKLFCNYIATRSPQLCFPSALVIIGRLYIFESLYRLAAAAGLILPSASLTHSNTLINNISRNCTSAENAPHGGGERAYKARVYACRGE